MNFQSMDYFAMVSKERSFTKAASALHITQQTLSAHIASLEQELGCKLLVRHVPLELTYAGEVFLQYALEFQKSFCAMQREFGEIANQQTGRLRIGVSHTRGRIVLPALIQRFQRLHPGIEVKLAERPNDVIQTELLAGEIDLAIAEFPRQLPGIAIRDFYEEEVVLFAEEGLLRRTYGDDWEEILAQVQAGDFSLLTPCPMLMTEQKDIAGRIVRCFLNSLHFHPLVKVESENMETVLDLCLRGVGACFSPENLAANTLTPEQLSRLRRVHLGESTRYMIRFGWLEQPYQWSMIDRFIQVALKGQT